MLEDEPDVSLFRDDVQVNLVPLGATIHGKANYMKALASLRWATALAVDDAEVGHRLVVSDGAIRVRWTARLQMRQLVRSASAEAKVVDGISVYHLDARGCVREHSVENVATHGGQLNSLSTVDGLGGALGLLGLPNRERELAGAGACCSAAT